MRKLVVVITMLLLVAGVVYAANTITRKAGDYSVDITIDKDPPIVGKNNVDLVVKDKMGMAVTDAKVVLELYMAPMPGMPAANFKSNTELKGDKYHGVIEPSAAGPWNLTVKIARGGKTVPAKLTLDVK